MTRPRLYTLLAGVVVLAAVGFYLTLPGGSDTKRDHARHAAENSVEPARDASRREADEPPSSLIDRILHGDHAGGGRRDSAATTGETSQRSRPSARGEATSRHEESEKSPFAWVGRLFGSGSHDGEGATGSQDRAGSGSSFWGGPGAADPGGARRSGVGSGRAPDPTAAQRGGPDPGSRGNTDPGSSAPGGGSRLYASTAGSADPASDTGPGTSPCTTGTSSGARCLTCEQANCPHDPKYRPYCEDFGDSGDQSRCQAVLDCMRQSNCIATGALSCYCGRDENVVTCTSNPPSTRGGGPGAHGDCISEIGFAFPPGSDSRFIVSHLMDVTLPGGAALSQGQCDYTSCGDVTATNECVPYCKE